MIVTIDGPAGAGKSTVARELARRLGFRLLDTGAMYRSVALAALERELDWDDPDALVALAQEVRIELNEDRVLLDGQDVTRAIRTGVVTSATHYAANNPGVRAHLVELQRRAVIDENVICEGRDQGTVVFPHAACKIYLTASPEERARRRAEDLAARGESATVEQVLANQNLRDRRDATRAVGRLTPAADAVEVCTDGLTSEQVVSRLEIIVREKMLRD
ncbi:MAG TPA: (d)CMP kinase [Pirellulales bacterium]|nr:(d)CMP kinase [Pirellulales bacterium]